MMNHIKIVDKSAEITDSDVAIIVAPVNKRLETSGVHKRLDYVIYNHRYVLRKRNELVPDREKVAFGDVYIIPEENEAQGSLMYAVLAEASDNYKEQLKTLYHTVFSAALAAGYKSIRLPSLALGVFHYPVHQVIAIGLETAILFQQFKEIQFYCYNDAYYEKFTTHLQILKQWKK